MSENSVCSAKKTDELELCDTSRLERFSDGVGNYAWTSQGIRFVRKAHLEGMIIGLPWPDDRI